MTPPESRIRTVLVANRGEIARRVMRTCRDLGVRTVAVHSDPDADAPHVREADVAVRLPGAAPGETYLRADLVIDAARRAGADAIHPGYGFLSESADFARAVVSAGLTWIGPPADAIEAMGDKVRAKQVVAAAGVPVLEIDADAVGEGDLPVLVKAAAGGGGRGMRVVERLGDLPGALVAARAEAESAFGDGTVFVEPYLTAARHVEVQVLADVHGGCWVLGDRDCSLQRRHQKVVEEAPAPGLPDDVRVRLHDAARRVVEAVGYVGAGTVEMLVEPPASDGQWRIAFLETNTRLQVEHPVTECVFGVDLVAWQLAIAEGAALPAAPDGPHGHAVEVRVYAEDPRDLTPQTGVVRALEVPGTLARFAVPARFGVRVDAGVEPGTVVGTHYDAMLAKVVAWGPDRTSALRMLADALRRARVHGVRTNLDLLRGALADADVMAGRLDTGLLEARIADWSAPSIDGGSGAGGALGAYALAVALADAVHAAGSGRVQGRIPAAYRNVGSQPRVRRYAHGEDVVEVAYTSSRGRLVPVADDAPEVVSVTADEVRLGHGGVTSAYAIARDGDARDVDGPLGGLTLTAVPRFTDPADLVAEGSLVAPMPGAVVAVHVAEGDSVAAGAPVLVLEAMKMQHTVTAPLAGTVASLAATVGTQVDAGTVLAVVEPGLAPGAEPEEDA